VVLREVTREGWQIGFRSLDADNDVETELDVGGLAPAAPAGARSRHPAAGPKP
jgi:hypothetical protein